MSKNIKLFFVLGLIACSIIGFMIKLPKLFQPYGFQLHAIFYFFATFLLGMMYPKKWLLISICLLLFGVGIEIAQEFSNKITIRLGGKAIHGNFDIHDIKYNVVGLLLGIFSFFIVRSFFRFGKNT